MTSDITPDLNQSLFMLASLSPSVAESIELELYRQSNDVDESTDDAIIADAIRNTLRDLETIGLDFGLDYSLLQQPDYLHSFTDLLGYILPNGLYPKLKVDQNLRQIIHHVLDGSLGHNETLIQCYLSELGGLDGQSPFHEPFSESLDKFYSTVTQTNVFTDYLTNVLDLVKLERLTPESDSEQHAQYREVIKTIIARMGDAVDALNDLSFKEGIHKFYHACVSDLTNPHNYQDYRYLFTTNKETLPDDLQPLFDRRLMWYDVSHPWHQAYFELRHITPTPEQIAACYMFAYGRHETKEAFLNDANRLSHWGYTHILTPLLALYGS